MRRLPPGSAATLPPQSRWHHALISLSRYPPKRYWRTTPAPGGSPELCPELAGCPFGSRSPCPLRQLRNGRVLEQGAGGACFKAVQAVSRCLHPLVEDSGTRSLVAAAREPWAATGLRGAPRAVLHAGGAPPHRCARRQEQRARRPRASGSCRVVASSSRGSSAVDRCRHTKHHERRLQRHAAMRDAVGRRGGAAAGGSRAGACGG
jgi:hypothetical protein